MDDLQVVEDFVLWNVFKDIIPVDNAIATAMGAQVHLPKIAKKQSWMVLYVQLFLSLGEQVVDDLESAHAIACACNGREQDAGAEADLEQATLDSMTRLLTQ